MKGGDFMSKAGITRRLAEFVEKTRISHIPGPVVQKAEQLITDFLGVTTAGAVEPPSQIIQGFIREQDAAGKSTIIGTSLRSQSTWAALANGIAGHALDFDDTSQPMYGHPTVPVLPAALAMGEAQNVTGPALLESYIVGLEVTVKLSYGMNPAHYEHGWHSTCTLGSIGSAVAVAKLLGLKGEKLRNALALAASQAGGLQQNFGTMTKPFHAGRAAENGVLAAILAQKGWTGDQNIMESPLGFFHIFCGPGQYDAERVVHQLGNPYDIEKPGIILKKFPSCAFSHPAVDAALIIAEDPQYDPSGVERVEGQIHGLADQILIHRNPQTGLEAKFSLEACIAAALLDGHVSSQSFTDEKVKSPDMRKMIERVERKVVRMDGGTPRGFGPAKVKAFLKGGGVLEAMVENAKGNPENPMSLQEIEAKYTDCCSGILPKHSMEKSLSLLQKLDQLEGIQELMACFHVS
jgi:2-methylcitrate dehydratase PrpD